jgi:uncharacterized protein (TIGR03437 family)
MRIRLNPAMLGLLLLAVPVAALANLTGTPTLSANTALSLDTGATSASGGDILWSGSAMTPQSSATAYNIGALGATGFSAMTQSTLSSFSSLYSKTALPASTLVVGDVFAVKTNAGNYAAVLVTATAGTSITLQFTTFGVNSGPTITVVENNYGDVPAGFSNSGIAQGALFFVFGSGLATPGTVAVLQNAVGNILPTTINGASIKVTVGSTTVTPAMYYAQPTAVAGVLPSNTPLGAGTVTVTYNNQTSNSYNIQVVASAMGFDAWNQGGTGLGVATNPSTGVLYTYSNSIPPGTVITLWGSGLGADPKPTRDTTYVAVTSVAADSINGLTHIYVGGVDGGAPGYQGASGYPGLNQINFTIPANAPTGCNVSMVGTNSAGVPTNIVTLPIGTGTCSDPTFGTNGAQLQTLSGQTTVTTGLVGIFQSTTPSTSGSGTTVLAEASAIFESYTGSTYAYSGGQVSIGGCTINQSATAIGSPGFSNGLDAGTVTVTNPSGTAVSLADTFSGGGVTVTETGFYSAQLTSGYIPTTGGTFTFKGTGGSAVGAFTAMVTFPNPVLTWTNQSAAATVTRSSGLPVMWTGGASGTYVGILGNSSSTAGAYASFTCIAPLSAGQFTVPAYILTALPAGTGSVTVENSTNYQTFTASGINNGIGVGYVATQVNSTFN